MQNLSSLFHGRIGRAHFAYTVLALFVLMIVIGIIDGILGDTALAFLWALVALVAYVVAAVVSIGVSIRRYHDMGWSGWFVLLGLIPVVNLVMLAIQLFKPGMPGNNAYGAPLDKSLSLQDAVMNRSAGMTATATTVSSTPASGPATTEGTDDTAAPTAL